jgi:MipA family protein
MRRLQAPGCAPYGRMGKATKLAALAAAWIYAAGAERAQAQGLLDQIPPIPADWTVTIGAQGKMAPDYDGAKKRDVTPMPVFGLRPIGGKAPRFRAPLDGPSIALINVGGFYFGPTGKFRQARKESDDADHLRGLGDVNWAIEAGVFAEYWFIDWLRTRAEVRRGFHGHTGFVADLSADAVVPLEQRWTLSGGPRLSFADTKATAPYFGIDAVQSLASGLPTFDAKGGLHSFGAGVQARYQWTPQWEVRGYVEYSRLTGDAASSPLVVERGSRDQITLGFGASYAFDIKLW